MKSESLLLYNNNDNSEANTYSLYLRSIMGNIQETTLDCLLARAWRELRHEVDAIDRG